MGKRYNAIIFDLDGTLMDTSKGILKSVNYVLNHFSFPPLSEEYKKCIIGPPIQNSLKEIYNLNDEQTKITADLFREVYKDKFLFEAIVYDGIFELLDYLKSNMATIGIATYKRHDYALKLLDRFKISEFCDGIEGSDFAQQLTKLDIIDNCVKKLDVEKARCIYIGDTLSDGKAAEKAGIDFAAVSYGFGFKSLADFSGLNSVCCCNSVQELQSFLSRNLSMR